MKNGGFRIFSGNANRDLALKICKYLKVKIGDCLVDAFADGEIKVEINENIRGADIFIVQPTCHPVNNNLMELLIMLDAFKRASAHRITAVMPFYSYARQDRKDQPRVPISAKLVANLITSAGADRVLVMDLHTGQVQGFFDIPVDHLLAAPLLVKYFEDKKISDLVVVAPDVGSIKMARAYAKKLGSGLSIIDKRRSAPDKIEVMELIGDVKNKNVLLVDDEINTAGTLTEAVGALKDYGANHIYAACTHGIFSGPALERINNSALEEVVITDSMPLQHNKGIEKIKIISTASLLGEAISRIHNATSVSSLFI
jgi:ribose-phosphate pyrophosphokinase